MSSYKLHKTIDQKMAGSFPTHMVLSSEVLHPDMTDEELEVVCGSFVDTMLAAFVAVDDKDSNIVTGIYLPEPKAAEAVEASEEKKENNDEDESEQKKAEEEDDEDDEGKQGRAAIVNAMMKSIDDDFLPLLMQAMDDAKEKNPDDKSLPELGALFTRRGEMQILGSLQSCGFGMTGVFVNAKR